MDTNLNLYHPNIANQRRSSVGVLRQKMKNLAMVSTTVSQMHRSRPTAPSGLTDYYPCGMKFTVFHHKKGFDRLLFGITRPGSCPHGPAAANDHDQNISAIKNVISHT
jgi:iron-sulfur cluster repair protein YtfE (RIC family)